MPTPEQEILPLVSVVMPAYNHEKYIEEAIRSVFAQTYPRLELVVVDDFSSDRTPEIIEALRKQYDFSFYRNESNLGLAGTMARALSLAQGDYLSVLASDDMILPAKVALQVKFLQERGLDAVYSSGFKLFNDGSRELIDTHVIEKKFNDGSILEHIYVTDTTGPLSQSGLFSKRVMDHVAPFRTQFRSDDHMLLIKSLESFKVGFIPTPVFVYRIHKRNSYKSYWSTLPMRIEIASRLTPERLRPRALANIFYSHAQYLYLDGRRTTSMKFLLASVMLWPNPGRTVKIAADAARGVFKYLLKRSGRS